MGGTGVIDRFLEVFTSYIDSGFGLLNGEVAFLSSTLVAIDITLAGLFWALASDEDVIARLIRKTLYVGFFAFLIGNFNTLAKVIFNSFAGLGLKAAGSGLSADQFVQPGRIAQVGIDAGKPILQAASQLMGFVAFFENFVQIVVLLIAWVVVLVAFFILAVQLFITLIEFKLTTLAGFVLVPFGLFNKTAFRATSSRRVSKSSCLPSSLASARPCSASSRKVLPAINPRSTMPWRSCSLPWHCSDLAFSVQGSRPVWLPVPRSSGPVRPSAPRSPRAVLGWRAPWACGLAPVLSQERSAARGRRWPVAPLAPAASAQRAHLLVPMSLHRQPPAARLNGPSACAAIRP
jgi:TrbL/VirB6 plasmid conjugal transfer protein